MRVLVVFAHPSQESFAAAVRDAAVRGLAGAGHAVEVLDLYADGFAEPMSRAEWAAHADPATSLPFIAPQVEQIRRAEALVLIFPTWHIHIPAALKAWMDRVWLPGIAYRVGKSRWLPLVPLFTHIRHAVAITTYDLPRPIMAIVLGNPIRRYLRNMFGAMMGRKVRQTWLALDQINRSPRRRTAFLAEVEQTLARL